MEKPRDPRLHAAGGSCRINLGIYCFRPHFLKEILIADSMEESSHDLGKDILPRAIRIGRVFSCPLGSASPDGRAYWRDVGTIDSFFQASMDLIGRTPAFEINDPRWPGGSPFRAWTPMRRPWTARIGRETIHGWNVASRQARFEGANVVHSVLSEGARIGEGAELAECVIFPGAEVGDGARLRRVIVEEWVRVPAGAQIGFEEAPTDSEISALGVSVVLSGRRAADRMKRFNKAEVA